MTSVSQQSRTNLDLGMVTPWTFLKIARGDIAAQNDSGQTQSFLDEVTPIMGGGLQATSHDTTEDSLGNSVCTPKRRLNEPARLDILVTLWREGWVRQGR